MAVVQQFCTFLLGDLFLGIEVLKVQEVLRYQEMTSVPLAPREVHGLINLRGQIVTAIDLRRRLGLPPREEGQMPMNVIVRTDEGAVSLLVDEIGDVVEIDESTFEEPPGTATGRAREFILGVFKLDQRLLLILDTTKVVRLTGEAALTRTDDRHPSPDRSDERAA